ncbi:transposase-like protein [Nitrobacteraceae bacterium AZCC 2161]
MSIRIRALISDKKADLVAFVASTAALPAVPLAGGKRRSGPSTQFTVEMIAAEAALGGSVREIAARLGAGESTVYAGMAAAGLTLPREARQAIRAAMPPAGKSAQRRRYSEEEIVAAINDGGTVDQVAERLGCGRDVITKFNKRTGRHHPRQPANKALLSSDQLPAVWIDANGCAWDAAARERLIELSKSAPRPSVEALAFALGRTPSAVQTALSRFGVTRAGKLAIHRLKNLPCITCKRAFLSEGHGNRMCDRCRAAGDNAVAA